MTTKFRVERLKIDEVTTFLFFPIQLRVPGIVRFARSVNKIISVNVIYKSLTNKVAREAPGIQENLRQNPLGPMALGVVGGVRMGCDPGPIPDSA